MLHFRSTISSFCCSYYTSWMGQIHTMGPLACSYAKQMTYKLARGTTACSGEKIFHTPEEWNICSSQRIRAPRKIIIISFITGMILCQQGQHLKERKMDFKGANTIQQYMYIKIYIYIFINIVVLYWHLKSP